MVHGSVGMGGIVQVLVHIPQLGPEVWVEGPARPCKRTVLVEAGLAACRRRIGAHEHFVPGDQAQARFELQRVHEAATVSA